MAGNLKVDSPTVQRVGVMLFLQIAVNLDWTAWWRKGDVSTAFLQGAKTGYSRTVAFILTPPPRKTARWGVKPGDLLEVVKSVYGLPDAPRAWWEATTSFLRDVLGLRHSALDVVFLAWYHPGAPGDGTIRAVPWGSS